MALGFIGLFAMFALGFGHGGHGGHAPGHAGALGHHSGGGIHDLQSHAGTLHGAVSATGNHGAGHAATGHHESSEHASSDRGFLGKQTLLMLLAPRVWFSLLFGFGAAGCLLNRWVSGTMLIVAALVVAGLFERCLVQPVWNFVLSFASNPARTLESAMLEEAVAKTNFDADGTGLISVTLDGQIRQMLGKLQKGPELGGRVLAGDRLIIVGIDARRNMCTVAKSTPRPELLS